MIRYETLQSLANDKQWDALESEWLQAIGDPSAMPDQLLPIIDAVVDSGEGKLAETMGWAWLSSMKEKHSPHDALRLGRGLLLRLPDGDQLRDEILTLYQETHKDHPKLDDWVERSGLKGSNSVRRALRFLDVGLRLEVGGFLVHRTEDTAAEVEEVDLEEGEVLLRMGRRTRTLPIKEVVSDYQAADANDFHVLEQLHPERILELIDKDPLALARGVVRMQDKNKIDRDEFKLLLVPKYIEAKKWSDLWTRIRSGVRNSSHFRIEGRSPTFLVFDPVGQTPEQEAGAAFADADTPRQWLEVLEGYLRGTKQQGLEPNPTFVKKVQTTLKRQIDRFKKHHESADAFATALIVERLAQDGLPIEADVHEAAVEMLKNSKDPESLVASVPDTRLWSLGIKCVEQAFPESWPEVFAKLVLYAPAGQTDTLAKQVEKAGKGELLKPVAQAALADPGRFTDAFMWLWKGPTVEADLSLPPALEMLNTALMLCGPARQSEGKAGGQTANEMRAKVRTGLSARSYEPYAAVLTQIDLPMAKALRRQIERAEGLGPSVQSEMLNRLTRAFPDLYVKIEKSVWEDDETLYFTRAGLKAREAELDELVNVKMRENAKAIGEAAAHGDLSENSEYKFALEERDLLRARVAQINGELSMAKIIEPADVPTDHVSIGQRVTLRPCNGGAPRVMTILGVGDSDVNSQTYAYQTPLAQQLMGRKVGGQVTMSIDGENERQYEIAEIECALE